MCYNTLIIFSLRKCKYNSLMKFFHLIIKLFEDFLVSLENLLYIHVNVHPGEFKFPFFFFNLADLRFYNDDHWFPWLMNNIIPPHVLRQQLLIPSHFFVIKFILIRFLIYIMFALTYCLICACLTLAKHLS